MAYLRLSVVGTLQGNQTWSFSIATNAPASTTAGDVAAYAVQAYTDFLSAAWNTSATGTVALKTLVLSADSVTGVRAYWHANDAGPASITGASTAAAVAGTGISPSPPQCALVASLLTGFSGRSNRGRIYLPYTGGGVAATGRASKDPGQVATTVANWLSLVRTRSLGATATLPIVHGVNGNGFPITAVRVDNVVDTQRRRRDKITATATGNAGLVVG